MAEEEYVYCPDCKLKTYLKDHQAWDRKTCARKWIQTHCPRGVKRGCSTRLSTAKKTRENQQVHMNMLRLKTYAAKKEAKKRAAS